MQFRIYSAIVVITGSLINQASTVTGVTVNHTSMSLAAAEGGLGDYRSMLAEVEHRSDDEVEEDIDELDQMESESAKKEARKTKKQHEKAEKLRRKAEKKAMKL